MGVNKCWILGGSGPGNFEPDTLGLLMNEPII